MIDFCFRSRWFQTGFGSQAVGGVPNWTSKILPAMNMMLAAPVQGFLIWRCWLVRSFYSPLQVRPNSSILSYQLTKRSTPLLLLFLLSYAASFAFAIAQLVRLFVFDFEALLFALSAALAEGRPLRTARIDPICTPSVFGRPERTEAEC